jgi:hypothetical protein
MIRLYSVANPGTSQDAAHRGRTQAPIPGAGTIRMFLFHVTPGDAENYYLAAVLLACVAVLAAWAPARRAGASDPVLIMRE